MELPSLKKLFNVTSTTDYEELNKKYSELQDELSNISKSYDSVVEASESTRIKLNTIWQERESLTADVEKLKAELNEVGESKTLLQISNDKLTEENERLRQRLAKTGLQLTKLKTQIKQQERDVVDEIKDTKVEVARFGVARVSQIDPLINVSQQFAGTTVGHFVKHVMSEYSKVPQGAQTCELFESLDEHQLNILKGHFAKLYESFKMDCYNTACVLGALYDSGWSSDLTPLVKRMLKEMGSNSTLANAVMLCLPNNARFRKKGGGKVKQVAQLFDYLIKNPETEIAIPTLCTSFEVSTTTVHRFVYLAFLFTEKDNWSPEL
jgi:ElaB/YqjD/DUF883 family membrane-anchored ribosome-binding protein